MIEAALYKEQGISSRRYIAASFKRKRISPYSAIANHAKTSASRQASENESRALPHASPDHYACTVRTSAGGTQAHTELLLLLQRWSALPGFLQHCALLPSQWPLRLSLKLFARLHAETQQLLGLSFMCSLEHSLNLLISY